jgi:hypothetical protein
MGNSKAAETAWRQALRRGFKSGSAAKLAGEKALRELLEGIAKEARQPSERDYSELFGTTRRIL